MTGTSRTSLLLAASALAALWGGQALAQDCKPAHEFKTVTPGTLTVSTYEFPPYTTTAQDGTLTGVDGEILKRIAAKECLKLAVTMVDPAAAIQYVVSNRADLTAGDWYRTSERAKVLGLTAPLYLDQMGIFTKEGASTVAALEGKTIGTVQGYLWVSDLQKLFGSKVKLYPNSVALAQDLAAARIDAGADSYSVGIAAQQKGGFAGIQIKVAEPDKRVRATVEASQSGFPFTKSNTALGEALDANIKDLHESGEITKILNAFGLDASAGKVGEPRLVQ